MEATWKKTILTAAQEKTVALSSLAKYESNFEESGILHLFAQYEVGVKHLCWNWREN